MCFLRSDPPTPGGSWRAVCGLGLAGAFFFWFPALSLTELIRTEDLLRGKFDFHNQFPSFPGVFGYSRFYATGALTPLILAAGVAVAVCDRWIPHRKDAREPDRRWSRRSSARPWFSS